MFFSYCPCFILSHPQLYYTTNKAILSRQLPLTPYKNFAVTLKGIIEKVPHIIASIVILGFFPFTLKIPGGRDQFIPMQLTGTVFYHLTSLAFNVTTTCESNQEEY